MSRNNIETIAIVDAKAAVLACPGSSPIEDLLRAAMRATKDHWLLTQMGTGEGTQLRAAVAGFCLAVGIDHPDAVRVAREHKGLATLSAALDAAERGVAVDFPTTLEQALVHAAEDKPVGLLALWRETAA